MRDLIRFLTENWGGIPVWLWIMWLFPTGAVAKAGSKKKPLNRKQMAELKSAFESASRRPGNVHILDVRLPSVERLGPPPTARGDNMLVDTSILPKNACRHTQAVPVCLCDWRKPILAGEGELVSWFCPTCKEQLSPEFVPGVREVDAKTGQEVYRSYPKNFMDENKLSSRLLSAGYTPEQIREIMLGK